MQIREVCRTCSLTKKAVAYYMEQGLVRPEVRENGYRDFSEGDVAVLKKIAVLRELGLSTAQIRTVLSGPAGTGLRTAWEQREPELEEMRERQRLLRGLSKDGDWERTRQELERLRQKQRIAERLLNAFPGGYGRFLCLHFAPYLGGPIETQEQQEAYDRIVAWLDDVAFELPEDLQALLDEDVSAWDSEKEAALAAGMRGALADMEGYLAENREVIERWMAFKASREYRDSPAYRLETALRRFNSVSGYDDVFLPSMCILSKSYRAYHEKLLEADRRLLEQYPKNSLVSQPV